MKANFKYLFLVPILIASLVSIPVGRVTAQTFTTLHSFTQYVDGDSPQAGLVFVGNTLYGATEYGGHTNNSALFTLNTNGSGFANFYNFSAKASNSQGFVTNSDGDSPDGAMITSGNTLYGTTYGGSTNGVGTVFKVNTNGLGFITLHAFTAGTGSLPFHYTNSDGASPEVGLILSGNTLYGTTENGGTSGYGTVFKINTDGTSFVNLHSFTNGSDGSVPHCLVISGSTLYGTTLGLSGNGTVFAISTNGTGLTILHTFTATNFTFPQGGPGPAPGFTNHDGVGPTGLILSVSGNTLYGTAYLGGTNGNGTIFALNTNGTGFTNLHSFAASSTNSSGVYINSEGTHPIAFTGLILSSNVLYGTANYGGSAGNGTVFSINTDGSGFTTIYSFTATNAIAGTNIDGANPYAGLILSGNTLYGTAISGGYTGAGTVFSVSLGLAVTTTSLPNGTSGVAYSQTLTAFGGQKPYAWTNISAALPPGLSLSTNGVIFGTPTSNGTYGLTVRVTDALNNTAIQTLTLVVISPPSVVIQPTNNPITVIVGSSITLFTSVAGTGPFTYEWQHDGTNLPNSIISTVAGGGNSGLGDGGLAISAELNNPESVAVDTTGNIFIADRNNDRIREVNTNGIIETVAGGGDSGLGDGGAATSAELNQPDGVAIDGSGNLFIADRYNQRIRKVGVNGIITTVAGNGYGAGTDYGSYSGDGGPATNAELNVPIGIAVDVFSNIFIADMNNQRIRKVDIFGTISTVAGNGYTNQYGQGGFFGDGGAATNAELSSPAGVAVDYSGNLLVADSANNIIRIVRTNGIINTFAGNRIGNYSGDGGLAINAELYAPSGVAVDPFGGILIADEINWRIREIGTNGIITTVAGNGTNGYIGDGGSATNAELAYPYGVTVDAIGNLLIADSANNCIRKVIFPGATLALNDVSIANGGSYDVVVSSPFGSVTSSVVSLNIQLPPPLQIATTTLPNGITGAVYSQQLSGMYGQPPFSWAISSGSLPSGLILAPNGLITGTPTVAGIANFTLTVTDALSATALEPLSITISASNNLCMFVPIYEFSAVDATLYTNNDGANPLSKLTLSGNTLFGTTYYGGTSANGTVFSIQTNGFGFTNYYSFTGGVDGACPSGGLILESNILYGTTQFGGTNGYGSIFAISTNGTPFQNLYGFTTSYTNVSGVYTNSDGTIPQGGLIISGNTMYGTASQGGRNGNGTVFSIETNGSGYTNLYTFTATSDYDYNGGTNEDGAYPVATLILFGNSLFGVTYYGGTFGNGTVFRINIDGTGFTNLYNFTATDSVYTTNRDGANPWGSLILSSNVLYGTASFGGICGYGTIFAINTDGTGFTNLYNFIDGGDGAFPQDGLILSGRTLYGTTLQGGNCNDGAVFSINTNGTGFTNLYSFNGTNDGSTPNAPLTLLGNIIYGTANDGGRSGDGTVFSISLLTNETPASPPSIVLSAPEFNLGKTDFTFQLSGPPGSNYVVQVSTNLLSWNLVSTSTIPVSGITNLSNGIGTYNRRFYRAHLQ